MEYTHIVFDLDGTLIDTEAAILKTWQYTLKPYNLSYSLESLQTVLGISNYDACKRLEAPVDDSFERNWIQNYSKFSDEAAFFPGIENMLYCIKKSRLNLGIVTSRKRTEYERYFKQFKLEKLFSQIVCSDYTSKHKPSPEPLLYYIKKSQADPASCMYIGDMVSDVECANAAGFSSGLVTWNHSSIINCDADYIFSKPADLLKILGIPN
ncbi:MAG: hypothetical protein PWP24_721 [Clostridiales bacterium]|nr:hypothetical protein [Clostridiales bacterium]